MSVLMSKVYCPDGLGWIQEEDVNGYGEAVYLVRLVHGQFATYLIEECEVMEEE